MAWSTHVVAGLWITCIALLFLAVGFAIPFWSVFPVEDKSSNVFYSVWYVMVCKKGLANSCENGALEPKFTYNSSSQLTLTGTPKELVVSSQAYVGFLNYWWAIQILTTIALGFVSLATLVLICCRCAGIHSRGFFIISAILLLFGGLTGLAISILAAITVATLANFPTSNTTGETFPWSILLFGIGSILTLAASIIITIISYRWQKYGSYYESDKESLQEEDEAAMSNLSINKSYDRYYDRPRQTTSDYRISDRPQYSFGNDKGRDRGFERGFSNSKKYPETDFYRGGHDNRSFDDIRNFEGRNYDDYIGSHRDYERQLDKMGNPGGYNAGYTQTRSGDNMYRPYSNVRY